MNVFLVLAHPEPRSFNAAMHGIARDALAADGHTVDTSELYAMGFDPASGRGNFASVHDPDCFDQQAEEAHATAVGGFAPAIEAEIRKVERCDLMIWQFPLWWFGMPAMLKGWVDRVFAKERTYGYRRIYDRGMFRGRRAMLSLTTGGPAPSFAPGGYIGDIHAILRPMNRGILQFLGFDVLAPHIVFGPARASPVERQRALAQYAERLHAIGLEQPVDVGRY